MRKIVGSMALLAISTLVWAAPEQLKFIATLSSPMASFNKVETMSCDVVSPRGEFNIGSPNVLQGTVQVASDAKPVSIGTLTMSQNTAFSVTNGKWLVNQLNVGYGGSVTGQHVLVDALSFANVSELNINVYGTLFLDGYAYLKTGKATNLYAMCESGFADVSTCKFRFQGAGSPTGDATWKTLKAGDSADIIEYPTNP